jgi:type III secretion system YscI/HrpB-like protein
MFFFNRENINGQASCPFLEKKMDSKISIQNQGVALGDSHSSLCEDGMPSHDDAQWFTNAMNNNAVDPSHNMTTQSLNKVSEMSEDLKAKSDHLNNSFKTATANDDFTAMIQTLRDISEYGFQTSMVTKVVSKATQAVDKLTNLN